MHAVSHSRRDDLNARAAVRNACRIRSPVAADDAARVLSGGIDRSRRMQVLDRGVLGVGKRRRVILAHGMTLASDRERQRMSVAVKRALEVVI